MTESPYQAIKRDIAGRIAARDYVPGQMLPSEHALCRTFGVARMTVNRAMRELAAANLVRRVPGVGTFVAEPIAQSGLVEIRSIAEEIAGRGHRHHAHVHTLAAVTATPGDAAAFALPEGGALFHSCILHCENDIPIQFEDRLVNPAIAPAYLAQDFACITPNVYLMDVAPVQEAAHMVQAIAAPRHIAAHLRLAGAEPCLLVSRQTWSRGRLAARTLLYHPGSRFRLTGRFVPGSEGAHA